MPRGAVGAGVGGAGLWALEDMPMGAAVPGVGGRGADGAIEPGAMGAAVGAADAAAIGAGAGAVEGIRMDGPPAGLGGSEMRTVCFFCAASAGFGGSGVAPGAPGGGVFSDIALLWINLKSFRRTSMRLRCGICRWRRRWPCCDARSFILQATAKLLIVLPDSEV